MEMMSLSNSIACRDWCSGHKDLHYACLLAKTLLIIGINHSYATDIQVDQMVNPGIGRVMQT